MQRITFSREALREVRTALPIMFQIAIRKPREAGVPGSIIASGPTVWQRISVGVTNWISRNRRACEVALAAGIAPRSLRIPMPRLYREFRILAIGHRLPARSKHLLEGGLDQILVDRFRRNAIHARPQGLIRHESVRGVRWCRVHVNRLCYTRNR